MRTENHTPGPWKVLDIGIDHAKANKALPVVVAEGGTVATVSACANPRRAFGDDSLPDIGNVYGCEGWEVGRRIAYANAVLIARAPDLLRERDELRERLSALLEMFEESHGHEVANDHGGDGSSGCSYCRTIAETRATLAKVTP